MAAWGSFRVLTNLCDCRQQVSTGLSSTGDAFYAMCVLGFLMKLTRNAVCIGLLITCRPFCMKLILQTREENTCKPNGLFANWVQLSKGIDIQRRFHDRKLFQNQDCGIKFLSSRIRFICRIIWLLNINCNRWVCAFVVPKNREPTPNFYRDEIGCREIFWLKHPAKN